MNLLFLILIILFTLINLAAVCYGVILNVPGNGGGMSGIYITLAVGGVWVVSMTAFSIYQLYQGNGLLALGIAAGTIVIPLFTFGYTIGILFILHAIGSKLFRLFR